MKKECLRASRAVNRLQGSKLRRPCNRSIRSPPEWSTCCITRFWRKKINTLIRIIMCIKVSIISHKHFWSQQASQQGTWRRGNFITALMLSLEVAPSGQFSLPFLKYFSAWRLDEKTQKKNNITKDFASMSWKTHFKRAHTPLFSTCAGAMDPKPSPSLPGAPSSHVFETKLLPVTNHIYASSNRLACESHRNVL